MNEQAMLDDLGAALDPPTDHPVPLGLRRRVMTAIVAAPRRRSRWLGPVGARLATVGGLAVLVIVAVSVVTTSRIGDHRPAASAEAAGILHQAATTAAQQAPVTAPRPDQFVFIESQTWSPTAGRRSSSGLIRTWRSADGTRDGLVWTEHPGPDGRSQTILPGCRNGRAPEWGEGGTLRPDKTRACQPDPAYLFDPPTTAKAMLAYLTRTASDDGSGDERAFSRAGTLLQTSYLSPQAQAAVYQAVALIPGVTARGEVPDAAGRPSIAVVRSGQGVRYEMLFDPQTYQFRGWQLEPGGSDTITGQQLRRQAVLRVAVVDTPGELP